MWEIIIGGLAGLIMATTVCVDENRRPILVSKILGISGVVLGVAMCMGDSLWSVKSFLKVLIASGSIVFGITLISACVSAQLERAVNKHISEIADSKKDTQTQTRW